MCSINYSILMSVQNLYFTWEKEERSALVSQVDFDSTIEKRELKWARGKLAFSTS